MKKMPLIEIGIDNTITFKGTETMKSIPFQVIVHHSRHHLAVLTSACYMRKVIYTEQQLY